MIGRHEPDVVRTDHRMIVTCYECVPPRVFAVLPSEDPDDTVRAIANADHAPGCSHYRPGPRPIPCDAHAHRLASAANR